MSNTDFDREDYFNAAWNIATTTWGGDEELLLQRPLPDKEERFHNSSVTKVMRNGNEDDLIYVGKFLTQHFLCEKKGMSVEQADEFMNEKREDLWGISMSENIEQGRFHDVSWKLIAGARYQFPKIENTPK